MKKFIVAGFVAMFLVGAAMGQTQDTPQLPEPEKEHAWLQQLVGQWESKVQAFMEPGKPPVKSRGTESVRAIGGFWIVAENKGDFMGQPFTGLLTLGYNTEKKQYVGTWIDSMSGYLWTYVGTVDPAGKVLTLESEGPSHSAPGKLSRYKEMLELKSKDHKIFTSTVQEEEGKWTTMMTIDYRRTKTK